MWLYLHGIETHISNVGINKMQLSPVIYGNYPCFFIRMELFSPVSACTTVSGPSSNNCFCFTFKHFYPFTSSSWWLCRYFRFFTYFGTFQCYDENLYDS